MPKGRRQKRGTESENGAGDKLLRKWERLIHDVCEHTGWHNHIEYRGDGSVARIQAWLPGEGQSEYARAIVYVYIDAKYHFRRLDIPEFYERSEEVRLFVNALMGEITSWAPPEKRGRLEGIWQRALERPRGSRGAVKKPRERGANEGTIEDCKKALEYCLDKGQPLKMATEQAGIGDVRTVKNRIADVLEGVPVAKREEWIPKLRARRLAKYLGRFK